MLHQEEIHLYSYHEAQREKSENKEVKKANSNNKMYKRSAYFYVVVLMLTQLHACSCFLEIHVS